MGSQNMHDQLHGSASVAFASCHQVNYYPEVVQRGQDHHSEAKHNKTMSKVIRFDHLFA